jgi:hypothetical protein
MSQLLKWTFRVIANHRQTLDNGGLRNTDGGNWVFASAQAAARETHEDMQIITLIA